MRIGQLVKRNLRYFWRSNLAVVLGVAAAVAVLAGALLVGDSVRGSLRDMLGLRLGQTDHVITGTSFFREKLGEDLEGESGLSSRGFGPVCPLIELEASVINDANRARAGGVRVYGVDDRFWKFHGRAEQLAPQNREVMVSESLARELTVATGESLLVQVEKPSAVPIESLYGQKEDLGRTLRLSVKQTLSADQLGEFSIRPQQMATRAVFVPLKLLQTELEQPGKVNTLLIASAQKDDNSARTIALESLLKERVELDDYGLALRSLDQQRGLSLERTSTLLDDNLTEKALEAAGETKAHTVPVLSYVANSISLAQHSIPYSLVTAIDDETFAGLAANQGGTKINPAENSATTPIILNEWAARDLGAKTGDNVSLEYYVWHDDGRLVTKTSQFQLAAIAPFAGITADRDLVPEYPGISQSESMADWNPPFPVDLKRIRKQDEDYWSNYRTTPKAFIPLSAGQRLWQTRFGKLTSLRIAQNETTSVDSFARRLKSRLQPTSLGLIVFAARREGLAASRGATDFGEYFLYFSFFLVVSALMLTALFFKLGVEQRLREIGVLQAIGIPAARVRRLFILEGLALSVIGSVIGLFAALGYGQLMMFGLNTWWKDAVGTNMLRLHIAPLSLLLGAIGGIVAAVACIAWTLRRLSRESTRGLIMGSLSERVSAKSGRTGKLFLTERIGYLIAVIGIILLATATLGVIGQTGGFFGSGVLFLIAILCFLSAWLKRNRRNSIAGKGWWAVSQLGFRNTSHRPARSVLCIALIASAAFIIVSVDAFRRGASAGTADPKSGTGGYPLLAESTVPVVHDLNSAEGRQALNLASDSSSPLTGVNFVRFRVRPGDDASCLNLYQPRNPRIIAPGDEFVRSNRFTFQKSMAETAEEKDNPWLLLNREFADGAVPVIADANSLTYVLHLGLGEDLVSNGQKLRVVAALSDSVFQSELIMGDKNFVRLFPDYEGYRFFLIDAPASGPSSGIVAALEDHLSDFGFDVSSTDEKLANFHRVENTYLSTFQMLGGLGLVLGTIGLGAVLLRNVFERRRELALLRAIGYDAKDFTLMVVAENALLLFGGLATGTICALLAIAPVFFERGGRLPNISLGVLLLSVLISGLIASLIATWAALRSPLLPALKAE